MSIIEKAASKLNQQAPRKSDSVQTDISPIETTAQEARQETVDTVASQWHELNNARLKNQNIITPQAEHSNMAEEFRMIKRPLLDNAFGQNSAKIRNGNLIMVTSSLPGEGKTFCTINLAMSIAMEMGRTVLLVDADAPNPNLLKKLGVSYDKGLLELLEDSTLRLSDVIIRTNIENLSLLPAGRHNRHATELLASDAMSALLDDMAQRYPDRIILFDSPPLLVTSEASVLASHMGQIVMVVEAEKTPQPAVKQALTLIENCELTWVLLNKARTLAGTDYYGYGYYGRS